MGEREDRVEITAHPSTLTNKDPKRPSATARTTGERVSTWVIVVMVLVVVRELFSFVTSAICVQIRGHRSEVTRIVYHMAPV